MSSSTPTPLSVREELRQQASLAWPVSLASLGLMMMSAVDVAVIGRLGAPSLAALAAGSMWSYGITIPFQFCLGALDPVISQAVGAGDAVAAGRALRRGLILAVLLSVPAMLLHGLARPGLALLGQPAAALDPAATFCATVAWGMPAYMAFAVLRSFLQAEPRPGLRVGPDPSSRRVRVGAGDGDLPRRAGDRPGRARRAAAA